MPEEQTAQPEAGEAPADAEAAPDVEAEPDESELTQEEFDELRANEVAFSWQASEYVHHRKGMAWYAILAVGVTVLAALAAWLHLWLEIAVFLVMGVAVVVYARKPPRTMLYELSGQGVQIDGRLFPFEAFRSFSVIPDEEWHSIDLEPTKRFSPRMVLLFDSGDFDEIVGHLELHLPRMDRELDTIERITRYLRF